MTSTAETFQIPLAVAEAYEARFVPALFGPWAGRLVAVVGIREGDRVLDVACGTGAVARAASTRAKRVVGLDVNEAMLTVARRLRPDLEWRRGDAEALPFPDGSFDVVTCQAALMFFPDPVGALREMARVIEPRGTVGVQVWDRRASQPAYDPFIRVVEAHAGADAVSLLNAYFAHGDLPALGTMLRDAGLVVAETLTESRTMRFSSVDELVAVEVQSTPLGERLAKDVVRAIVEDSDVALRAFTAADGTIDIPLGGHIVIAHAA